MKPSESALLEEQKLLEESKQDGLSYSPFDPHRGTDSVFDTAATKNLILPEPSLGDLGCIEENNEDD